MHRISTALIVLCLASIVGACGSGAALPGVGGSQSSPSPAAPSTPPPSRTAAPAPTAAPTAAPSAAPTAAPTAAPDATAAPADAGSPAALRAGFPDAGTYTTTLFQPRLTVSLDDGWHVLFDDDDDELALEADSGDGTLFAVSRVSQVVNPKNREVMDAPDDLIAWLRSHPSLVTDAPTSTTIDDRPAMSIDATTGTRPAVDLIAFPMGNFHLPPNVRLRFTVVPMEGPDLLISTGGQTDRFESAIARTGPVLASLQIGDQ